MMGTADELPKEPVQKTVFMEDMTEQQLASAVSTRISSTPGVIVIQGFHELWKS